MRRGSGQKACIDIGLRNLLVTRKSLSTKPTDKRSSTKCTKLPAPSTRNLGPLMPSLSTFSINDSHSKNLCLSTPWLTLASLHPSGNL